MTATPVPPAEPVTTADTPRPPGNDAHRRSEVARLLDALRSGGAGHEGGSPTPGLRIIGVSGPGGVGKSYLLRHVLDVAEALRDGGAPRWLKLSIDGSNEQARGDFFALIDGQLARHSLPLPAKPKHDYFPHVRKVAAIHRALVEGVAAELSATAAPTEIKVAAIALLKAGRRLNKVVPKTREYFDAGSAGDAEVGATLDEAWKLVDSLHALRDSSALPGAIRNFFGWTYGPRVKSDLYNVTADALLTDLSAAIGGYRRRDLLRFTEPPIPGIERLLLVIDDFESLAPLLEEFLVGALIPQLAEAQFPATLVILARDELGAMHPAWNQHCQQYLREEDQIRLTPFGREAAIDLLAHAGVPEARREELYQATQGFPFLLSLIVEEMGADGADSALFLRKFFDRTTRWMSPHEREWFVRACYLDNVNVDTLGPLFPGEDVEKIQDWFEKEASIRDPAAPVFRVRPLIREKVQRYLELRSPSRHREMAAKARSVAMGDTPPG